MQGAYLIVHKKTGKWYIGSSQNIERRIRRHFNSLRNGGHHNINLQTLYDKSKGRISFKVGKLEFKNRNRAYKYEQNYISDNIGEKLMLNIQTGAIGGDAITLHPYRLEMQAYRTKMFRKYMKSLTEDERKEIYGRSGELNGMFGKTHSDEVKRALSKQHTGNNHRKGKKLSKKGKAKLKEAFKDRDISGKNNPFYGKSHSEETKEKLRKSRRTKPQKLPSNTRSVEIDGKSFISATFAGKSLGVATATITHRIKSPNPKFDGYRYTS